MNKEKALEILNNIKYYNMTDLRYSKLVDLLLSKDEYEEFLIIKDQLIEEGHEQFNKLPLKTFNSKHCFYFEGKYLVSALREYLNTWLEDSKENKEVFSIRNMKDILISRVFSEIEGTLDVENVPTTHKLIKEVFEKEEVVEQNEIIIKNMQNAMSYILEEVPEFNKENLFKLYSLLSNNCLKESDRLKEGEYYRHDMVSVGGYDGVKSELIDEYMNSLFDFVNNKENIQKYGILIPHICHYYILYVHPYFDYNGRTARMVSFWINVLSGYMYIAPLFLSEAINERKKEYYDGLVNTRNANNDLTYFLGYLLESAVRFSLIYKNLEKIKEKVLESGEILSSTELIYIKKILIHNPNNPFNCKMFIEYVGNMSKQGAMKILNNLASHGIITSMINRKKERIFKLNQDFIFYKY